MKEILERLVNGDINIDEAENLINADNILEFDEIAKLDIKRNQRAGFPEAVFSPSKDYEDFIGSGSMKLNKKIKEGMYHD